MELQAIQYTLGDQIALVEVGRSFVKKGRLGQVGPSGVSRKVVYEFYLTSDLLLVASVPRFGKHPKLEIQLRLDDSFDVMDVPDNKRKTKAKYYNRLLICSSTSTFLTYAASPSDKTQWLEAFVRARALSSKARKQEEQKRVRRSSTGTGGGPSTMSTSPLTLELPLPGPSVGLPTEDTLSPTTSPNSHMRRSLPVRPKRPNPELVAALASQMKVRRSRAATVESRTTESAAETPSTPVPRVRGRSLEQGEHQRKRSGSAHGRLPHGDTEKDNKERHSAPAISLSRQTEAINAQVKKSTNTGSTATSLPPAVVVTPRLSSGPEYVRALYAFSPKEHTEMGLEVGDVLELAAEQPTHSHGWTAGRNGKGFAGFFPTAYVAAIKETDIVQVTDAYMAGSEKELSAEVGDKLAVESRVDTGWCFAVSLMPYSGRAQGWLPANILTVYIPPSPLPLSPPSPLVLPSPPAPGRPQPLLVNNPNSPVTGGVTSPRRSRSKTVGNRASPNHAVSSSNKPAPSPSKTSLGSSLSSMVRRGSVGLQLRFSPLKGKAGKRKSSGAGLGLGKPKSQDTLYTKQRDSKGNKDKVYGSYWRNLLEGAEWSASDSTLAVHILPRDSSPLCGRLQSSEVVRAQSIYEGWLLHTRGWTRIAGENGPTFLCREDHPLNRLGTGTRRKSVPVTKRERIESPHEDRAQIKAYLANWLSSRPERQELEKQGVLHGGGI